MQASQYRERNRKQLALLNALTCAPESEPAAANFAGASIFFDEISYLPFKPPAHAAREHGTASSQGTGPFVAHDQSRNTNRYATALLTSIAEAV